MRPIAKTLQSCALTPALIFEHMHCNLNLSRCILDANIHINWTDFTLTVRYYMSHVVIIIIIIIIIISIIIIVIILLLFYYYFIIVIIIIIIILWNCIIHFYYYYYFPSNKVCCYCRLEIFTYFVRRNNTWSIVLQFNYNACLLTRA